eukprot:Blabericola_migrator_1__5356@NODE_2745_length_2398_cov_7_032175_g1719_i0_p1_GENE_NODE_2745_length_2398_cov_7_032175_g1719_i0NODE_2745_length_2398_cov_7_032175_g1719_i0_p1_ORF_typecomplete_len258_score22_74_NODE_2745_length_2398_cov_7_032175_g1719_i02921065
MWMLDSLRLRTSICNRLGTRAPSAPHCEGGAQASSYPKISQRAHQASEGMSRHRHLHIAVRHMPTSQARQPSVGIFSTTDVNVRLAIDFVRPIHYQRQIHYILTMQGCRMRAPLCALDYLLCMSISNPIRQRTAITRYLRKPVDGFHLHLSKGVSALTVAPSVATTLFAYHISLCEKISTVLLPGLRNHHELESFMIHSALSAVLIKLSSDTSSPRRSVAISDDDAELWTVRKRMSILCRYDVFDLSLNVTNQAPLI